MKFYTVEQVADILQLTEQTVRYMLNDGRLKGFKAGKSWRVTEKDLQNFINAQLQKQNKIINK